jgi:polyhydroxybutyrate depolymerase
MKVNRIPSFLFLCFISLIIAACDTEWTNAPAGALQPGNWILYLNKNNIKRQVYVYVPSTYDGSEDVPLLLVFHGYMDTALNQMESDGFLLLSERENFIVAYPEGYGTAGLHSWNAGNACCGAAENKNLDDVGLARDIVTELSVRCSIDPRRVYAHGHSNGAGLAHRCGREAADVFAAITPKSMPVLVPNEIPSYPVSVLQFHGSKDSTISYNGGTIAFEEEAYISAPNSLLSWANMDGCSGTPETTYYGSSYCKKYTSCDDGSVVELCTLVGGNHNDLYGRDDIDVTEMSWDFMSQFTR